MSILFSFSTLSQYSVVEAETVDMRDEVEHSRDGHVLVQEVGRLREFILGLGELTLVGRGVFATLHTGTTINGGGTSVRSGGPRQSPFPR